MDQRRWLPADQPSPRRGALEDTLFRQLDALRSRPADDLAELVERCLDVLHATKQALLEQRREIGRLTATVEMLRSRVDELARSTVVEAAGHETDRAAEDEAAALGHLVLVSNADGYRLHAVEGPPPAPGDRVDVSGVLCEILNHGMSPLPGDLRVSVFAIPADGPAPEPPAAIAS